MKYYFVVDVTSGGGKRIEKFFEQIVQIKEKYGSDVIVHRINDKINITPISRKISDEIKESKEQAIVIACGGDSTMNAVLNGIINNPYVIFSVYPMGYSNDFLQSFKNLSFTNVEEIMLGQNLLVDVLEVNNNYSLNVVNIGFDAIVNHDVDQYLKKKKFTNAFTQAVIKNLITHKAKKYQIIVDDQLVYNGNILLAAFGNGVCYGNGYYCTPDANLTDGLIDICIIKKMSILSRIFYLFKYKKGNLYHSNSNKVISMRGKKISIEQSENKFYITLDGKDYTSNHITINNVFHKINFRIPKNHK